MSTMEPSTPKPATSKVIEMTKRSFLSLSVADGVTRKTTYRFPQHTDKGGRIMVTGNSKDFHVEYDVVFVEPELIKPRKKAIV